MRYCTLCRRITPGDPLYCNHCGSSYSVKLCPRRHVNSRHAVVCSICGSRDLSRPAPRGSLLARFMLALLVRLPAVFLVLLSLVAISAFIEAVAIHRQVQGQLVLTLAMLGILWALYSRLHPIVRMLIRAMWSKSRKRKGDRRE